MLTEAKSTNHFFEVNTMTTKKMFKIGLLICLTTLAILAFVTYRPTFLGGDTRFEPVLSGSMEPTYHVGSLIYVKAVDPADIEIGDPVTFKISENTMVTHRVVAIDEQNNTFETKGDANNTSDGNAVTYDNVVGEPIFSIPGLGYLAAYASSTTGRIIVITLIIAMLILAFLPDMIGPSEKDDPENQMKK